MMPSTTATLQDNTILILTLSVAVPVALIILLTTISIMLTGIAIFCRRRKSVKSSVSSYQQQWASGTREQCLLYIQPVCNIVSFLVCNACELLAPFCRCDITLTKLIQYKMINKCSYNRMHLMLLSVNTRAMTLQMSEFKLKFFSNYFPITFYYYKFIIMIINNVAL